MKSLVSKCWLLILIVGLSGAKAQLLSAKGAVAPLQVIATPHFRVLHPPFLETYARRVAAAAERIHTGVLAVVGNDPGLTYILVGDETDDFNGYALPGPYPFIRIYASFPNPSDIGAQWQDALVALVGHEFTHVAHLATRDPVRDRLRGVFGAVPGLLEARVPPAWFVEGYAVYLESTIASGGRLVDSGTRTLRRSIARAGKFPSLSDAGIGTLENYPFGNTRYVFGAGFVEFLMKRFGAVTVRDVIQRYNATLTFDDAFRAVTNASLATLWDEWRDLETRTALLELEQPQSPSEVLHAGSGAPAWQSASRYAFMQGNALRFANLESGKPVLEPAFTRLPSRPSRLSFAVDGALVYSRVRASGATTYGELYRFKDGVETRLTTDARAKDAVADGACVLFVRDDFQQSALQRFCDGAIQTVWTAPQGWHVFQPSVSAGGEIAMSLWRPGGFLDIAVLRGSTSEFLTADAAMDQYPIWRGDEIIFSSDRSGTAQLYAVTPGERSTVALTAHANGAMIPSLSPSGFLSFSSFTGAGIETRWMRDPASFTRVALEFEDPVPLSGLDGLEYALEPYVPNLLPLFWTPLTASGIGATVYGADAAGIHSYQLSAGYALLGNTGFGVSATYSYAPQPSSTYTVSTALTSSLGFSAQISAALTGRGESLQTGRFAYTVTPYANLIDSSLNFGLSIKFDAIVSDVFGYTMAGWKLTSSLETSGQLSIGATLADRVANQPVALMIAVQLSATRDWSFSSRLQTHVSIPIHWRFPDGFVGLERVTVLPFAAFELKGDAARYGFGAAALLDLTFNYYAPVSLGFEMTWNSGNGWTIGVVSLVPLLSGLRLKP